MNESFDNIIFNKYRENKLSHVYLVETNNIDVTYNKVLNLCKKIQCTSVFKEQCSACNVCSLIDSNNHPNVITICPDGQNIKKEQVLTLKNNFFTKPVISSYNIYIIKNAECLNESSSNSLLKFLEEPADNILGFLVTNNAEKLLSTIISRCQKYIDNETCIDVSEDNDKIVSLVETYYSLLNSNSNSLLKTNKETASVINNKDKLVIFLNKLLDLYLNDSTNFDIKKIILINGLLDDIRYNINIELLLDKLVLEMSDINA